MIGSLYGLAGSTPAWKSFYKQAIKAWDDEEWLTALVNAEKSLKTKTTHDMRFIKASSLYHLKKYAQSWAVFTDPTLRPGKMIKPLQGPFVAQYEEVEKIIKNLKASQEPSVPLDKKPIVPHKPEKFGSKDPLGPKAPVVKDPLTTPVKAGIGMGVWIAIGVVVLLVLKGKKS